MVVCLQGVNSPRLTSTYTCKHASFRVPDCWIQSPNSATTKTTSLLSVHAYPQNQSPKETQWIWNPFGDRSSTWSIVSSHGGHTRRWSNNIKWQLEWEKEGNSWQTTWDCSAEWFQTISPYHFIQTLCLMGPHWLEQILNLNYIWMYCIGARLLNRM